jgi:DNA-binding SARP family transcriptional activator
VYRKSLALLAYLAITGHAHSRGVLAGMFWEASTEANARANLRKVLVDLKRPLCCHLAITRLEVGFDKGSSYWLDVEEFDRRIDRSLARDRVPLTREGATALTEAVALYRGDFLDGLCVHNAPAFEQWMLMEREHLRLQALRALDALVDHHAARGDIARAIACTERLLALEPAQEEAHRRRMALLACSGQRAAALRQYKTCRQALAALDAEPDGQTERVYEQIRRGVP